MNSSEALHLTPQPASSRMDAQSVLRALEAMSQDLRPGDLLPTQLELIRRFNASDRAVRWALDELRRQGKVISKRRVGTVIVERNANVAVGNGVPAAGSSSGLLVGNRTIVVIATPGQAVFERALSLLFHEAVSTDMALVYRLFDPRTSNVPQGENPLGYILFGRDLLPLGRELQNAGHRVVLVGTPYAGTIAEVPCVYGDQEKGGYLATRHLLDLGHERIVFRGSEDWPQMRRWRGHQRALSEAQERQDIFEETPIFDDVYQQWRQNPEMAAAYFNRSDAPTGIVVWNDQMALSLLSLLSYSGVRVPQDVCIVGYDDLPEVQEVHPQLTTVNVDLERQIKSALGLLTQESPPAPTETVMVTSKLVRRESTAAPNRHLVSQ